MANAEEAQNTNIRDLSLEDEMKTSYLTYAMSVIVSRALPDVRDGLKPSQRRILYAMRDLNLSPGAKHRKCAKIAGDTSGNYHPHGEQVIYPTLVRMAQDFNMRYRLVDGQGNFGTIDGDPPAAMRYTEARMTPFATMLMEDIDKNTIDFVPNYDETRVEPVILPSKFPNLLCNGSSGIAVAMATSIPPHNVGEVCDALIRIIDEPEISLTDLMQLIPGPDFPTGGIIYGRAEIAKAYKTGRGILTVRGKVHFEEFKGGRQRLVITEIPYQVNRTKLIEHIAALVKDGKVTGISDIRDESDRKGSRLVVELRKGENEQVILNLLYKHTSLQESFSIILIALVKGRPLLMGIREFMDHFLQHRLVAIRRRTQHLLDEAEKRAHILDGLRIACANIDEVIRIIRASRDPEEAANRLIERFKLSTRQVEAIIRMPLGRLTGLEQDKLTDEYHALLEKIKDYRATLSDDSLIMDMIREDLYEIKERHADKRRTEIEDRVDDFLMEDLITEEDMVVSVSHLSYIKSLPLSTYRSQRRGGKGVTGSATREGDFIEHLFVASTHDTILVFTDRGKVYGIKVYRLPKLSRQSKGRAIRNVLELAPDERIASVLAVREFDERYVILATKNGIIKKTELTQFANPRVTGKIAIKIDIDDRLVGALLTCGLDTVFLASRNGMALRFSEEDARPMGRATRGVSGIRLGEGDEVVSLCLAQPGQSALTVCEKGYGKRTPFEQYRHQKRGGKGVINIKTMGRNGHVVAVFNAADDDAALFVTARGMVVRTPVEHISKIGRATQGVRVVRLKSNDRVQSAARLLSEQEMEKKEEDVCDTGVTPAEDGPSEPEPAGGGTSDTEA